MQKNAVEQLKLVVGIIKICSFVSAKYKPFTGFLKSRSYSQEQSPSSAAPSLLQPSSPSPQPPPSAASPTGQQDMLWLRQPCPALSPVSQLALAGHVSADAPSWWEPLSLVPATSSPKSMTSSGCCSGSGSAALDICASKFLVFSVNSNSCFSCALCFSLVLNLAFVEFFIFLLCMSSLENLQ